MSKPEASQALHEDPEKHPNVFFPHLTPIPSSGSTLEDTLDAEANVAVPGGHLSESEKHDDPEPPPNGGFKAWLQVSGSFFLFFNCWVSDNRVHSANDPCPVHVERHHLRPISSLYPKCRAYGGPC